MLQKWEETLVSGGAAGFDGPRSGKTLMNSGMAPATYMAKADAALAANSDATAAECAAQIMALTHSKPPLFSASVVSSRANKRLWPTTWLEYPLGYGEALRVTEACCFLSSLALQCGFPAEHKAVHRAVIPANELIPFLDLVARREARSRSYELSSELRSLMVAPSLSATVYLDDLLGGITANEHLVKALTHFVCSGCQAEREDRLTRLIENAKSLKELSLTQCSLRAVAPSLFEVLKKAEVEALRLDGNELGSSLDDGATEEICTALAEMLKVNKFLMTLNLAYNNFDRDAVTTVMDALSASDTTLTLEDLPAEPEEEEPRPEDLVDTELFFGADSEAADSSAASEDEEEEEEGEEHAQTGEGEREDNGADDSSAAGGSEDGDDEAEENEEGEEEAAEESEASGSASEDDEDPEEKERLRLARVEAKAAAKLKRSVRRLTRDETAQRQALLQTYVQELIATTAYVEVIRGRRKDEKRVAAEAFCKRRSGWSRVQRLTLRGNAVGDRGVAAVARLLREEVPLEEEEVAAIENKLQDGLTQLIEKLQTARLDTLTAEATEWASLAKEAKQERKHLAQSARDAANGRGAVAPAKDPTTRTLQYDETSENAEGGGDDDEYEDEFQRDAPPVVMTNVDDNGSANTTGHDAEGSVGEENGEGEDNGEDDGEALAAVEAEDLEAAWTVPVLPTKQGMHSIRYLDLGSCEIGGPGLDTLATVLQTNVVLHTLILRNNRLGGHQKRKKESSPAEVAAPSTSTVGGDVSRGFRAFCAVLRVNHTLQHLDLGYCQLLPAHIHALASALDTNTALVTLCVEGNHVGEEMQRDQYGGRADPSPSALLALLLAVSRHGALRHLNVSYTSLGECFWQEEVEALAAASTRLESLYLNGTDLNELRLQRWSDALGETPCALEVLHVARNGLGAGGAQDGAALGAVVSSCPRLKELCLDENPLVDSWGLAAALANAPPTLRCLSCNRVGVTSNTVGEGTDAIPSWLLGQLDYLSLSDVAMDGQGEVLDWLGCLASHAHHLRYLSLWSRRESMEEYGEALTSMVNALPSLLFLDAGVLVRYDAHDRAGTALEEIERVLIERRMANCECN